MNSSDFRLVRLIPVTGTGSFSGGGGSFWDSTGVLQTAPPNTLRVTYDPSDLSKAPYALVEQSSTNEVRNNTMQGAAPGSPGSTPTYWGIEGSGTNGLIRTVLQVGVEDGIEFMDIRYAGTATAGGTHQIGFDTTTWANASTGESWGASVFLATIGAPVGVINPRMQVSERTAAGAQIGVGELAAPLAPNKLSASRLELNHTLVQPGIGKVSHKVIFSYASGSYVDVTLRIGLPQLELGKVTSPIKTSDGSGTRVRAADVVGPGAGLVYSNVPITEPLWVSGTYALGARVRDAAFLTYESQAANNTAALTDKTKWLPLGATNQRKAFDKAVNSQTSAPGLVAFAVKPGSVATTLMLLNMEGASVTVSQSDSGYVKTQSLVSHEVDNWYDFYYEEPVRAGDAVFTDIPPYPNSMLTVAIDNGPLEAKIGACLVGKPLTLGKVTASFRAGVLSYSTSTNDTFGNITMVKRYNAPRMNFELMIPAGSEDFTYRVLRDYTDTEIGAIVGDRFTMGIAYGFLGQWEVPKSGSGRTASIEFKGLV